MSSIKDLLASANVYSLLGEQLKVEKTMSDVDLYQREIQAIQKLYSAGDKVSECIERAVKLAQQLPNDTSLLNLYALALVAAERFKDALSCYDNLIKLNPVPEHFFFRGSLKGMMHDYEGSAADFSICTTLNEDFPFANFFMGKSLIQCNDVRDRIKGISVLFEVLTDTEANIIDVIAELLETAGSAECRKALLMLSVVTSRKEGNPLPVQSACFTLAAAAVEDIDEAMKFLTTALELDPNNSAAFFLRGKLKLQHVGHAEGMEDIRKAQAMTPHKFTLAVVPDKESIVQFKRRGFSLN